MCRVLSEEGLAAGVGLVSEMSGAVGHSASAVSASDAVGDSASFATSSDVVALIFSALAVVDRGSSTVAVFLENRQH